MLTPNPGICIFKVDIANGAAGRISSMPGIPKVVLNEVGLDVPFGKYPFHNLSPIQSCSPANENIVLYSTETSGLHSKGFAIF